MNHEILRTEQSPSAVSTLRTICAEMAWFQSKNTPSMLPSDSHTVLNPLIRPGTKLHVGIRILQLYVQGV